MQNDEKVFLAEVQVNHDHYVTGYDDKRRWTSYFLQWQSAIPYSASGTLVEVGVGNGVTTGYLRSVIGATVITVDIDQSLKPDVVADATALPFDSQAIACILSFEVLEHMPLTIAFTALQEFRRVAHNLVLSVPNAGRFSVSVRTSLGSRWFQSPLVDVSRILPSAAPLPDGGEHYWELNRGGFTVSDFTRLLGESGWSVIKEFRNPDFPYHHFFILA